VWVVAKIQQGEEMERESISFLKNKDGGDR